jgi:hypothetical protein
VQTPDDFDAAKIRQTNIGHKDLRVRRRTEVNCGSVMGRSTEDFIIFL